MITSSSFLFFLTTAVLCSEEIIQSRSADYILCRTCGHDVSSPNFIISKSSPSAQYYFNDTLFDKVGVQVQVFVTDVYFVYPLITVAHSGCVELGEWEVTTSWFPGYRWKPCVCPECGAYIGFVFEPIDPASVEPSKTFYGLILSNIISENFVNSLTRNPIDIPSN